jgi:broad specificity phosphatase PhoE
MLVFYGLRHGHTPYVGNVLTPDQRTEVLKGPFLDLTPSGIQGVKNSSLLIADNIMLNHAIEIGNIELDISPSLRTIGTAKVLVEVLKAKGISINDYSEYSEDALNYNFQLRNYDCYPPDYDFAVKYPQFYQQILTQETLTGRYPRFPVKYSEGRSESSKRSLLFLEELFNVATNCNGLISRTNKVPDVIFIAVSHSEVLSCILEHLFAVDLPMESTATLGKSSVGIQRAEFFKITIFNGEDGEVYLEIEFKERAKRMLLSSIQTEKHHLAHIYKSHGEYISRDI